MAFLVDQDICDVNLSQKSWQISKVIDENKNPLLVGGQKQQSTITLPLFAIKTAAGCDVV